MSQDLTFLTNRSNSSDIKEHFLSCDPKFTNWIKTRIPLVDYATKIATNAERIEAWSEDRLIGLIAVYCNAPDRAWAYITNVSVLPHFHGQRIAFQLMERCLLRGRELGFTKFKLEVQKDNEIALGLYRKLNFKVDNTREGIFILSLDTTGDIHV